MNPEIPSVYTIAEYRLVIEPHEALMEEIMLMKQQFAKTHDCPDAIKGKPNITLVRFQQYEMIEQRIIRRIKTVASSRPSFKIELNGFGSFPTHTLYLNVSTQNELLELVRSFKQIQLLLKIDKERKPHFINQPHLLFAQNLLPWQYEKGWLALSNTHFSGRFVASQLLLLRRRDGVKKFTVVLKCDLLNVNPECKQGELFSV